MDKPAVFDDMVGMPFAASWGPVARPQTVLVMAPMYHTNGFATLFSLLAGDHLVVLEKFDAARIVDLIEAHGVTTFTATTTMLQRIADLPGVDDRDLSSLEWILQGAAVIAAVARAPLDRPGRRRAVLPVLRHDRGHRAHARCGATSGCSTPGSVGRGYRETEIRILDPDGNELPAGETGEIYMRSPSSGDVPVPRRRTAAAAHRRRLLHRSATSGGSNAEGYLHIVDRRVDMIITGGANVFPAEVETALIDHPEHRRRRRHRPPGPGVGSAGPRHRRTHRPRGTAERSRRAAYAKQRLAAYKVPKSVEFVATIPRSEATKVSRAALIEARGG